MSNRVAFLTEQKKSTEVHFQKYIEIRRKTNYRNPVFIIEGKDDPKYYTSRFSSAFSDHWEAMSVQGKSNVLKLRDKIRENHIYKNDFTAFFVDRDFDDQIILTDLYTTPTYSIENLYCTATAFKRTLEAQCGLSGTEINGVETAKIKQELLDEFISKSNEYCNNLRLTLTNLAFFYTRHEARDTKTALDDIVKIKTTLDKNLDVRIIKRKKYFDTIKSRGKIKKFGNCNQEWALIKNQAHNRFRGKQQILFMITAIEGLAQNGYFSKIIKEKYGVNLRLENPAFSQHLLSNMAAYASTPPCLIDFMRNFISHHQKPKETASY